MQAPIGARKSDTHKKIVLVQRRKSHEAQKNNNNLYKLIFSGIEIESDQNIFKEKGWKRELQHS